MESNGVPTAIEALVAAWRSEGRPAQAAMSWPRRRWIEGLPEHVDTLRTLPHELDRVAVRRACSDAAADTVSAVAAFIAVMAWGFGNIGYGPHRTREILSATPDAPARLARIARTLSESGAVTAYRRLARDDESRLRGLGPAFGTKYLYFCQPRPAETTALILDGFVAEWLRCEVGLRLNPLGWSEVTYRRYLEQMHRWADALDCTPDELEYCIFQSEATKREGQWSFAG